ncbi:Adenosine deaminase [Acidisarcina polymorpha]|uniref:adenosine deaminase n=1 Tax=Acidisarcina polymorpha TaxID=2211140 RepID=A0A2Z5FSS6_9BACT|nr:adenosine deaminase [Acidisarcina polymorpha]AXC09863.1 Adenosine deaminase [Acidisarcina polymorpha]
MLLNHYQFRRIHQTRHPGRAPQLGFAWLQRGRTVTVVSAISALFSILNPGFVHAAKAAPPANPEVRAARALDEAAKTGPAALRGFLYAMPKGADLHMHLTGAVYAESFISAAAKDGLCVDSASLAFVKAMAQTRSIPPQPVCGEGRVRADSVTKDQHLYDELIDSFSMRTFIPVSGKSGHDQFFDTFERFDPAGHHVGLWLDEVATRAAAQNEQYLEIMHTPSQWKQEADLAEKVGYHADFAEYRQLLLDGGFRDAIPAIRAEFDKAEAERRELEGCGTAEARPACTVQIRYLDQVLRAMTPDSVFAQILLGFELASADPRIVGLNLVQPEDSYVAMTDYHLHMQMIEALHAIYPKVHITLHAGEIALGLVPPEGLKFHIREAVEIGSAERIGHGVDVMDEDKPYNLLQEMAAKKVMVEINLTSNDVILNVKGGDHPLPIYRKYHVPVALSTDDEGVSRIDLTHEYVRAVDTYHFTYPELKDLVRTGLEHNFLPGESLWQAAKIGDDFARPVAVCAGQLGKDEPAGKCAEFLKGSEKAQQQFELERRFRVFEATF